MYDHKHYVPILRWKRAEWVALGNLSTDVRDHVTPLVEPTPRSFEPRNNKPAPDPADVLARHVADLERHWGSAPFFVDMWHLTPRLRAGNATQPLEFLAAEARGRGLSPIPVTGLGRDAGYQKAVASVVANDGRGACIRILPHDIQTSDFAERLFHLLSTLGLEISEADCLLDYQVWQQGAPSIAALSSAIPRMDCWRTFTVASGAFPRDLTGFTIGQHTLPRFDWMGWRNQLTRGLIPVRLPGFADYTMRLGPVHRSRPNSKCTIRCPANELRGKGGRPGYRSPANRKLQTTAVLGIDSPRRLF